MTEEPQNGPLSWRDVYRAVNESEVRLTAAIDKWGHELKDDFTDHEARLRIIEDMGTPLVQQMRQRFELHLVDEAREITELKTAKVIADAQKSERGAIILSARTAFIAVVSIISSIIVSAVGAAAMFDKIAK